MNINFSIEQQAALLNWVANITSSEVDSNIEPSGYCLEIFICPPWPEQACAVKGSNRLDLGDVQLNLA